jgi:hypothetical protein
MRKSTIALLMPALAAAAVFACEGTAFAATSHTIAPTTANCSGNDEINPQNSQQCVPVNNPYNAPADGCGPAWHGRNSQGNCY